MSDPTRESGAAYEDPGEEREPLEPLSLETVEALGREGVMLPTWKPTAASRTGTVWTISIRRRDDTDLDEDITLLSTAGRAYWFEGGVVIQTDPTGFGDFNQERVIPWSRVIEYHSEHLHA